MGSAANVKVVISPKPDKTAFLKKFYALGGAEKRGFHLEKGFHEGAWRNGVPRRKGVSRRNLEVWSSTELRGCRFFSPCNSVPPSSSVEPFKKGSTEEQSSTAFFYCLIKLVAARPKGPSNTKV